MEEYIVDKNGLKKKKPIRKFTRTTVYKVLYREASGRAIIDEEEFTVYRDAVKKKEALEKKMKPQGYYNFLVVFPQVIKEKENERD